MSVDVEIYVSNIIKFFQQNPSDLLNLVPKGKESDFYLKVRETALKNYEDGKEVALTRSQMLEICREINTKVPKISVEYPHIHTKYGIISLN